MITIGSDSGARRRSTVTVLDHGVSSGSNFLLSVLLARTLSVDGYGAFSVCFALYTVAVGFSRATSTDPLLVLHGSDDAEGLRSCRGAVALNAIIGAVIGIVITSIGVIAGGTFGPIAVAVGLTLPILLAQDGVRYSLIARRRPDRAMAVDLVWIVVMVVAVAGVAYAALPAWAAIAVWSAGALVSIALAQRWIEGRPSLALVPSWFSRSRRLGWRFAAEFVVIGGAPQVVLLVVSIASLASAGALRGGWVLFGPPAILVAGMASVALAEGSREWRHDPRRAQMFLGLLLVLVIFADSAWGLLAWAVPDSVGTAILGDTWSSAHQLVPALTANAVSTAGLLLGMAGLRASGQSARTMRITIPTMVAVAVAGGVGALVGEAEGAVWAMVAPTVVGSLALWWALVASYREVRS
jgi:O-antigen/teichoic acid export membrane protein